MTPTRDDLELYVMGAYDGDASALEAQLANDPTARAALAAEADLELLLREAAAAATFCPACDDVVRGSTLCVACGAAVTAGGYTIERVLVQNTHGRMYVARDIDGKRVALKELAFVQAPNAAAHAAFEQEARMLRALEHPAIPCFVAAFEEGSGVHMRYYLAQELVEGEALDRRLAEHFYTEAEIAELARHVLRVLIYLQGLSPMVVHRDIKPANLIAQQDGTITVVDFGAAHVGGTTAGSTSIGTFGYMPVEQMAGIVDATTDTYALGASLLHLLTRREPWKLLQAPAWDSVNVSPAMRAWLRRLVAAEPRERFPSAQAALDALDSPAKDKLVITPPTATARWAPRAMLAAAIVLAASGIGFVSYRIGLHHAPKPESAFDPSHVDPFAPRHFPVHAFPDPGTPGLAPKQPHVVVPLAKLPAGPTIDVDFKDAPAEDVVRFIADKCKLNLILPDSIGFKVTARTTHVPCDAALETVLDANGLWYDYEPDGALVRIVSRKQLDLELEAELERSRLRGELGLGDDSLPAGKAVDLDFKSVPLRDLVTMLTTVDKGVNFILPDSVGGKVTLKVTGVPWNRLLPQVLKAQGLWYRYRPNAKMISIAPQKQIDLEDEAELARRRR